MIFNTVCRGVRIPKGYAYDHVGEHSPKFVSPLVTITKHGYTKHYFEGMNRICSKLGGGFDDGLLGEIEDTVPTLACDYVQQSKRQNEGVNRTFADCLGMGAEVDGKYDLYKVVVRETERDEKEPAFYYHSDHLGSAAYLTNDDGKVTQTLNYLPYGEDWVDVRYDLDPSLGQYRFNGKEKDHESGFHYYGARYYWSELLAGWLSVDPLADKYPSISPYNYCLWNPVKLVDPDGRDVWEVDENGYVKRTGDDGGTKKQTVKYANGNTATFRGARYHKVMSDLSTADANDVSSSYGGENMQSAYANVFKSMADNTNVEWAMHRYKDNHYALGTNHNETLSPNSFNMSKGRQNDKTLVALIHSHPMASGYLSPTSTASQISSMGYNEKTLGVWTGDANKKVNYLAHTHYYTYFPRTKQLWSVGYYRPAYIRNIGSAADFFFGTFNTK